MASFTFSLGHPFPAGTEVFAYRNIGQQPSGPLPGTPVSSGVVTVGGVLTIDELAADTAYWGGGVVEGLWQWVGFSTEPAPDDDATDAELAAVAAAAAAALALHEADETLVHGITNTAVLAEDATVADAAAAAATALSVHAAETEDVHGIADTAVLATLADVAAHAADHNPHGIHFTTTLELFGPEPREAHALQGEAGVTTYDWPGSALSASVQTLVPDSADMNIATLVYARWLLVHTPKAVGCGVRLVHCDAGPTNIVQFAEFTGDASATPIAPGVNVTADLTPLLEAGARKFVGHQLKGDGSDGPLVYVSRLELTWAI